MRLQWPLTAFQVEALDEMLYELYKRVGELSTGVTTGSPSSSTVPVSTVIGLPLGLQGEDGAEGAPGIQGLTGAAGAAGVAGAVGPPGQDGQDGDTAFVTMSGGQRVAQFGITVDGAGTAITTGIKGDVTLPYACYIDAARLVADQSGSIVFDIWVDTLANFPPTVADTITASAKPTLSSATNSEDTTLTGWTRALPAGSVVRFNVDSAATVTRVALSLRVRVIG